MNEIAQYVHRLADRYISGTYDGDERMQTHAILEAKGVYNTLNSSSIAQTNLFTQGEDYTIQQYTEEIDKRLCREFFSTVRPPIDKR